MNRRPSRRWALALAALVTTGLGLAVRVVGDGTVSELSGDALYAVLVYVLVALVTPGARPPVVATVAWGLCAAVELAQLVGLSAVVVAVWDPARWVLGTTFHAPDLLVYAAGACVAAVVDAAVSGRVARLSARGVTGATVSPSGRRGRPPRPARPSSRS